MPRRKKNKRNKRPMRYDGGLAGGYDNCIGNPFTASLPQLIAVNVGARRIFRFYNAAAVTTTTTYTITPAKVGAFKVHGISGTSVNGDYEAAKIDFICIRSAVDTNTTNTGPPPMCSVEWAGVTTGFAGPNLVTSAGAVGATRNARVISRPPRGSQAAQWAGTLAGNTAVWFVLIVSGQCWIDIGGTFIEPKGPVSNPVAITGPASPGLLYYLALDNNGGGTGSTSNTMPPENSLGTIT